MMKTKHISLSISLLLITNLALSQYHGGVGDGSILFNSPLNYLDGSLRTSLFMGGTGDGHTMGRDSSIYLDGVSTFAHLLGGSGDGFNFYTALNYYTNGTTIGSSYEGGNGEGTESYRANIQFLEGSVLGATYQGGISEGSDLDIVSLRFLDGAFGCAIYDLMPGKTDSVSNGTYSQEIIVYYAFDPGVGNLIVNGQSFPITGSPQSITLTELSADGMPVDVTASFSDLPDCNNADFALFIAPDTTTSSAIYDDLGTPEINFSARPNPFSSQITFSIKLNRPELISMDLMTLNGQKVSTLFEGNANGGQVEEISYDGSHLPQGIYLCRLKASGHVYYKKLVKLK